MADTDKKGDLIRRRDEIMAELSGVNTNLRLELDNDPEEHIREKAVFAISQLPNDRSVPLLIELMKTHRSKGVRRKAAFWLGQKDDPRALEALADILR